MPSQIFVNLPVTDLPRARRFYTALGFALNERFSNDQGACIVISEHIFVMLLVRPFFQGFTHLPVADPTRATAVLITRPVKQLKAFARVDLKPGQQALVSFKVPVNLLAFVDSQQHWVVEPGEIKLMIGSSSADLRLQGSFNIAGDITDVGANRAYLSAVDIRYE